MILIIVDMAAICLEDIKVVMPCILERHIVPTSALEEPYTEETVVQNAMAVLGQLILSVYSASRKVTLMTMDNVFAT